MTGTEKPTLPRKPKGQRPQYFEDPAVDKLIGILMALAGEVAALHDRHDTVERLAEAKGLIRRDEIEAFRPTAAIAAERDQWREIYLAEILRAVQQELEGLEREPPEPYEAVVKTVSED